LLAGWWFGTWILLSISYMGCHPSHWRTPSFSRWAHCTTYQFIFTHDIHHYNIIIFTIKLTIISTSLYLLYSPLN
jgi:hypothetical protein